MNKKVLLAALLLASSGLMAQEKPELAPVPQPPELPPQVQSGEVLEPDVTIIESDKGTIEQYSINGRVYMVKVTPVAGPPYYLLDSDGDGELDVRNDHPSEISVPQWVLFSW